ncbi:hypothetical protein F4819DRAFT_506975 [Hypoxylon fuscum]|nr:hypothetical protein F4819DRAFT_506975 [Hypoxylon fuscum]
MAVFNSLILFLALSNSSHARKCGNRYSTSVPSNSTSASYTYPQVATVSSSSDSTCTTQYGLSSIHPVPTSSWTTAVTLTATKWVVQPEVTSTVTPSSITVTSTKIDTSTTTVAGEAKTGTATVTETTSTTTVEPPAGFTPISEDPDYVAKRKVGSVNKSQQCSAGPAGPVFYPSVYAESIDYISTIYATTTITSTSSGSALPATTTLSASTITTVVTTTVIGTSTSFPAEVTSTSITTVTSTTISTKDVTITTTIPTTKTVQSELPVATYYAACGSKNLLTRANGNNPIQLVVMGNNGATLQSVAATSAYDCCMACMNGNGCHGSFYAGFCYIIVGSTCSPGSFLGEYYQTGQGTTDAFTMSNGPCGLIRNGGAYS